MRFGRDLRGPEKPSDVGLHGLAVVAREPGVEEVLERRAADDGQIRCTSVRAKAPPRLLLNPYQ